MAIASSIVLLSHYQNAEFLKPRNTFFMFNNDLITVFSKLPLNSQHLLYLYLIIIVAFYYMLLR